MSIPERDGPEVAALSTQVAQRIERYQRQGMARKKINELIEAWLYQEPRTVPEGFYVQVVAEAWAQVR